MGFGLILLASAAMLVGLMWSNASGRAALLETMHKADAQQEIIQEMRTELLNSAISVRNMGLQTEVSGVTKDEAEARKHRAAYIAAKEKLEAFGLDPEEKAVFERLADIDKKAMDYFKEAVDLQGQFNTDQSSAIITGKIDPLSVKAVQEMEAFITLQKQHKEEIIRATNAANTAAASVIGGAGIVLLVLAVVFAWNLTRSITSPLKSAVDATDRIAEGDLLCPITVDASHDKEETAQLLMGLLKMRNSLSNIVANVRSGAENISTGSREIASGNADLSQRTEMQASNLQQTAASMMELSSTVKNNAETARQANQMAISASLAASKGGEVVNQVISTMDGITASSRKISDIISVIDGIAFQTNILALNAAVEAARAGEQGRGFAVVASEVRALAGRSAEAAKEIKYLINASVEGVENGSRLVGSAGESMTDIVAQVKRVADLIGEISASAQEQTQGIEQVNQAVAQLDNVTQQNAALVEEAAAAADSLNHQAARMVEVVGVFKIDTALQIQNSSPARIGYSRK
jgi:methyl-accepting chemotaxis protein